MNYDRYLQTPKPGKSIFTRQRARERRRARLLIVALLIVAVALALVWFFVLR